MKFGGYKQVIGQQTKNHEPARYNSQSPLA